MPTVMETRFRYVFSWAKRQEKRRAQAKLIESRGIPSIFKKFAFEECYHSLPQAAASGRHRAGIL